MDFNKIKAMGLEYAEKGKNAAMDLAEKGKTQALLVNEQGKLLKAQRQLGAPHCGQVLRAGWAGCSGAASSSSTGAS